ncbi:IclR family transcriptional regulator [Paenibacillus vulneris]|uniref:IclR family transcriptional regulator n=1 Tax=Paenibacillus vulneris TaxID=1133364 RepID=A0ABW3UP23_9BACL|nr:IclR family transcriptional regulator [Paenibacillus sp. 32352]
MNGSQTLVRALDIIFALGDAESMLTVTQIAEKVSIPESTAYRLIQTLEKNGILERKEKGQISLGLRILDLARSLHYQMDRELYMIARPFMERLTEQVQETTVLAVRVGSSTCVILAIESRRFLRFVVENGRTFPIELGATGKSILAFEKKKVVEKILNAIVDKETRKEVNASIEAIKEHGYAVTLGEVDQNIFGVAAPIFDDQGQVVASLTVAGPKERFGDQERAAIIQATLQTAGDISEKLNGAYSLRLERE